MNETQKKIDEAIASLRTENVASLQRDHVEAMLMQSREWVGALASLPVDALETKNDTF